MNKLFIIGNGFDMAHGLPTSYNDFREYLIKEYPDADEYHTMAPGCRLGHHGEEVYDNDEVAGYLLNLISRANGEDWRDLESSLGQLDFDDDFDDLPEQLDRDGEVNYFHGAYLNEDLASQLEGCVPMILNYFSDWINTVDLNIAKPKPAFCKLIDKDKDLFLNFNYTKTLEKVYKARNVCHIHGVQGGELMLGHGEEDDLYGEDKFSRHIGSEDGLERIHRILRKDTQRAINLHSGFFKNIGVQNIEEIYSYGFSFSNVDLVYLEEIFKYIKTENVTWYIHKYNEPELKKITVLLKSLNFNGLVDVFDVP